jgi:flavin-binding protein dodecin
MAKTVKVIELLAESDHSWEDAATVAVEQASKTLRPIRSIYVEKFHGGRAGRTDQNLSDQC